MKNIFPLPKRVKIGAADYVVKQSNSLEGELGTTSNRESKIRVSPRQAADQARDTLLHEALHAIVWCSGAQRLLKLDDDDEEALIRLLAPWLLALLRDNTDLVSFLLEVEATGE